MTMNGLDVIRLHQSARSMPSATVLLVALAGALACSNIRRVRLAAVAVGIAALATTIAGVYGVPRSICQAIRSLSMLQRSIGCRSDADAHRGIRRPVEHVEDRAVAEWRIRCDVPGC